MTIAILTFQNSDNFGALLQAYSLQTTIKRFGEECVIIDYYSPNKKDYYDLIRIGKGTSLRNFIGSLIRLGDKIPRRINANLFRKNYLELTSKKYYSSNDIKEDVKYWDKIIVGSDQVWNYENTKFDTVYLLDFISDKKKKYSYAASFGVSEIPEKKELENYHDGVVSLNKEYSKLLGSFNKISVREEAGKDIAKDLSLENVEVSIDPTLLLNGEDWKALIGNDKKVEPYILVYSLDDQEEMYKIISKISKMTNLPVKQIFASKKAKKYGIERVKPNIIEFIKLFNNAYFVVTDSFHGTAFSINLNKNFYSFYHEGTNKFSRIENLLTKLDMKQQIISSSNEINTVPDLDFENSNKMLEIERKKSLDFISSILIKD